MLHWSRWRRWQQAWARYYHHRRRQGPAPLVPLSGAMPPPMLIDVLWRRLAAVLPPPPRLGRPCVHDRRLVLEAIVYVRESDCTSRMVATKTVPSGGPDPMPESDITRLQ